jgi:hypothetical protein
MTIVKFALERLDSERLFDRIYITCDYNYFLRCIGISKLGSLEDFDL